MPRQRPTTSPTNSVEVLQERIYKMERQIAVMKQAGPTSIETFDKEAYEDPTQGEVAWHWVNNRGYIWHVGRWRPLAPPTYHIKVFADSGVPLGTTGDGKFKFFVTKDMDGMDLFDAEMYVTTLSGAVTVQIRNITQAADMLSTPLTIDSGELSTKTAATQRVINLATDDVVWGDQIAIDVDAIGGTFGLGVCLVFNFNVF